MCGFPLVLYLEVGLAVRNAARGQRLLGILAGLRQGADRRFGATFGLDGVVREPDPSALDKRPEVQKIIAQQNENDFLGSRRTTLL